MKIYIPIIILLSTFAFWFSLSFKKRKARRILKKKILNDSNLSYSDTAKNVAMSISKARVLYKNLIVKVHPDKFQNDKDEKANELASRITAAKRNYDELRKIEIEVTEFLKE